MLKKRNAKLENLNVVNTKIIQDDQQRITDADVRMQRIEQALLATQQQVQSQGDQLLKNVGNLLAPLSAEIGRKFTESDANIRALRKDLREEARNAKQGIAQLADLVQTEAESEPAPVPQRLDPDAGPVDYDAFVEHFQRKLPQAPPELAAAYWQQLPEVDATSPPQQAGRQSPQTDLRRQLFSEAQPSSWPGAGSPAHVPAASLAPRAQPSFAAGPSAAPQSSMPELIGMRPRFTEAPRFPTQVLNAEELAARESERTSLVAAMPQSESEQLQKCVTEVKSFPYLNKASQLSRWLPEVVEQIRNCAVDPIHMALWVREATN